jgi:hypothetical protein
LPLDSLNWALVAIVPVMPPIHFDTGRFCTVVNVVMGNKLLLVCDTTEASLQPPLNLKDCDIKSLKWVHYVLGPGHKL